MQNTQMTLQLSYNATNTLISMILVLLHQLTTTTGILPISTVLPSHIIHGPVEIPTALHVLPKLTPVENNLVRKQPPEKPVSYFYQALLSLTSKE